MKKLFILSVVTFLAGSTAFAQSQGDRAVAPAKVENKENLKETTKGEHVTGDTKTQLEQTKLAIVELENFIRENRTREGFDQAAYDNRLNILRQRHKELSAKLNDQK